MTQLPQPPVTPAPPAPSPAVKETGSRVVWLVLGIISLLLAVSAGVVYFLLNQQQSAPISSPTPTPISIKTSPSPSPIVGGTHAFLYSKNNNLFIFKEGKETAIATDSSALITYRQPKWIDPNNLSFIRCVYQSEDNKKPYSCSLVRQNVDGTSKQNLLDLISKPNANGYHSGAIIHAYVYDPSKNKLAYAADVFTPDALDFGKLEVHYLDLTTNTNTLLQSIKQSGGRGGSLDDQKKLEFSPDGTKLLFVNTTFDTTSGEEFPGTLFVYNLTNKEIIWQPKKRDTFVNWLSNELILAKEGTQLIQINLSSKKSETVIPAQNWYNIQLTPSGEVIYWGLSPVPGEGGNLDHFDMTTKTSTTLKNNVLLLEALPDGLIVVRTMNKCTQDTDCPIDMYNGSKPKNIGFFNPVTTEVTEIPIPQADQISEIDVL